VIKIMIKPMSVNEAFQGRRFKTPKYIAFEKELLLKLPKKFKMPPPPYEVYFEWGFSNRASDFDNPIKCTMDVLQKKYGFNDKEVYLATIRKTIVGRGEEFIMFSIKSFVGD